MKAQNIRDIERAAWFARLALGAYPASARPPATETPKPVETFLVLP